MCGQEPILFDMTIEENIKLGNDEITTADMVHACKIANCHEFIKNLPKVRLLRPQCVC